ncbi:MAG: Rpn family recombination-promoting nuclease/putative transposase [Algicola sp.]|nr:Rpn family recombination-promoting nuclease/putative transposase [Algicola sp.]
MKYFIDPTVDCVFKAILGMEGNEDLLVHFLNCILMPMIPIVSVTIINPYNEKTFLDDKLSIVDIKAINEQGVKYQIEVQIATPKSLPKRMLYTWSDIYQTQIKTGTNYSQLQPVISIWLLTNTFFHEDTKPHHHFQVWDRDNDLLLTDNCSIHVFELAKWQHPDTLQANDFWLYFFKEGKNWKELPKSLFNVPQLRLAMKTLEQFSEREAEYHLYQSRQDAIRVQLTQEAEFEEERALREQAEIRADKAETAAKNETARADAAEAQLKALLAKTGKTPD